MWKFQVQFLFHWSVKNRVNLRRQRRHSKLLPWGSICTFNLYVSLGSVWGRILGQSGIWYLIWEREFCRKCENFKFSFCFNVKHMRISLQLLKILRRAQNRHEARNSGLNCQKRKTSFLRKDSVKCKTCESKLATLWNLEKHIEKDTKLSQKVKFYNCLKCKNSLNIRRQRRHSKLLP